jgi:DDE superfamily endonuclease/CENP-B N-terminal DNA-binding domain/Tc5 transposase DNA-binding domain
MEQQEEQQELSEMLIQIPIESASAEEEHLDVNFQMNNEELEIVKLEAKNVKKRVSLTIEKKIEIIQRHEGGVSQKTLAQEYNVGRTTISDILKRKYKFLKFMVMNADKTENLKRRRTLRRTVHKVLEDKLFEWYTELRENGQFVSGPMVANKARELHKELGYTDNFTASNGWLDRFKIRNGIKLCGLREVKSESDANAVGPFKTELESLAQWYNLSNEQIYNADETDLFWKMLPNPESDLNEVKSSVRAYRERITILCCTNATGTHKLPLVCIGRGKKSRIFSSNEIKQLPVHYYSQETAWMDNEIFKNWFHTHFIPSVREHLRNQGLPETAMLLIDRNPSHPSDQHLRSEDNFFFVQYFPGKLNFTLSQKIKKK